MRNLGIYNTVRTIDKMTNQAARNLDGMYKWDLLGGCEIRFYPNEEDFKALLCYEVDDTMVAKLRLIGESVEIYHPQLIATSSYQFALFCECAVAVMDAQREIEHQLQ